jgi:hypothetical protein
VNNHRHPLPCLLRTGQLPTAPVKVLGKVEARLRAKGFVPGVPDHLDEFSARVDVGVCNRMVCGGCKRRGLLWKPFKLGRRYAVVALCINCGPEEEV